MDEWTDAGCLVMWWALLTDRKGNFMVKICPHLPHLQMICIKETKLYNKAGVTVSARWTKLPFVYSFCSFPICWCTDSHLYSIPTWSCSTCQSHLRSALLCYHQQDLARWGTNLTHASCHRRHVQGLGVGDCGWSPHLSFHPPTGIPSSPAAASCSHLCKSDPHYLQQIQYIHRCNLIWMWQVCMFIKIKWQIAFDWKKSIQEFIVQASSQSKRLICCTKDHKM